MAANRLIHTTIIRHPRERRSKCSLTPLEGRDGLEFLTWSRDLVFDASEYTVLCVDAPPLGPQDATRPLLVLDATWKLLEDMQTCLRGEPVRRSIPAGIATAYPRISKHGFDPAGGLASVEALFVARALIGFWEPDLLDDYHWAAPFLERLPAWFLECRPDHVR